VVDPGIPARTLQYYLPRWMRRYGWDNDSTTLTLLLVFDGHLGSQPEVVNGVQRVIVSSPTYDMIMYSSQVYKMEQDGRIDRLAGDAGFRALVDYGYMMFG
jgi:hypothetical protein